MSDNKKAVAIIILDDGETWGLAHTSSICVISVEEYEKLTSGEMTKLHELKPLVELSFHEDQLV